MGAADLGIMLSPDGHWKHWKSLGQPVMFGRFKDDVKDPAYGAEQFLAFSGPSENTLMLRNMGCNRAFCWLCLLSYFCSPLHAIKESHSAQSAQCGSSDQPGSGCTS